LLTLSFLPALSIVHMTIDVTGTSPGTDPDHLWHYPKYQNRSGSDLGGAFYGS